MFRGNIYGLIDTGKVILITTTLLQEVFTQRNFVADFIRLKLTFIQKTEKLLFEPPFGDLGVMYALHL